MVGIRAFKQPRNVHGNARRHEFDEHVQGKDRNRQAGTNPSGTAPAIHRKTRWSRWRPCDALAANNASTETVCIVRAPVRVLNENHFRVEDCAIWRARDRDQNTLGKERAYASPGPIRYLRGGYDSAARQRLLAWAPVKVVFLQRSGAIKRWLSPLNVLDGAPELPPHLLDAAIRRRVPSILPPFRVPERGQRRTREPAQLAQCLRDGLDPVADPRIGQRPTHEPDEVCDVVHHLDNVLRR